MKTILTLQTSTMFFLGEVNLHKGVPSQIDTDVLSDSTVRMVNKAITSGIIHSSEGPLISEVIEIESIEAVAEVVPPVVEEAPQEEVIQAQEEVEVKQDAPVEDAPVVAPKKKATPAKKKAE